MVKNAPIFIKLFFIIIALANFIEYENKSLKDDDFKTNFECYLKAIEILKIDRADMQRQIDYLNQQNTKNLQEMEIKLNETSAQYQALITINNSNLNRMQQSNY
jgi:ACT domain-containing protein